MNALPAILRFKRLAVERIWGGHVLADWLGLSAGPDAKIGEVWVLHDRGRSGSSRLLEPAGGCRNLRQLMERHERSLLGAARPDVQGRFPLMLKFLDARDRLSLQVHPDEALVRELGAGDSGKDEAWVVLRAEPGAWLVRGQVPGATVEELFRMLEQGEDPEPLLQRVESRVGEVVDIPAGTLHCIGPGNLLYEIQKNSDLTYRLSDWGRLGQDGQPRQLHLAEGRRALEDLRAALSEEQEKSVAADSSQGSQTLVDCSAFFLKRLLPEDSERHETRHLPQILTAVRGAARIRCGEEDSLLKEGETCLIRGEVPQYDVDPEGAGCELLLAMPHEREGG